MRRDPRRSTPRRSTAVFAALGALLLLLAASPAAAQAPGLPGSAPPADTAAEALATPEGVRALVAELPDEEVRRLLLERLIANADAEAEAPPEGPGPIRIAERAVAGAFLTVADAVLRLPNLVAGLGDAVGRFWAERGVVGALYFAGLLAVAVFAGLAAEQLLERVARRWRAENERMAREADNLRDRVVTLARRLALDVGRLVLFYFVVRVILVQFVAEGDRAIMAGVAIFGVLLPRIIAAFSRFLLAPSAPALRLVAADDAGAAGLHRDQCAIGLLIGIGFAAIVCTEALGVPLQETRLGFWLVLAVQIWIGIVTWNRRETLISMMRGFDADLTETEERAAQLYPSLAVAANVLAFLTFAALIGNGLGHLLEDGQHLFTLAVVLLAPAFDTLVRGLVRNLAPEMTGEGEAAERAHASMLRSWIRIGRVVTLGLVLAALSNIWGLGIERLFTGGAPAPVAALARFVSVLLFGYIAWEVARLWFNTRLMREHTAVAAPSIEDSSGEGGGAGASRLSTVLPLVSFFVQATIVVMTLLVALSNLGVDVTPLLAGAGVLGLAIGFGAQKLVTDVVSGLFFLIDDAFRTGEFVDVGGTTGKVEKISIRSMQLRGHLGPVHTIPYGEIGKITNYSRDWVIMKLKFTVPFDTDLEKVRKIFKKIGKEMLEIPELAEDFIEPFKSQGVLEVNDVGIVLRGKFMAKPGTQFVLRKEIYTRVQRAFEEAGIQFARKEVRVRVDGGDDLSEPERQAVAAAAQEAAEAEAAAAPAAPADAR